MSLFHNLRFAKPDEKMDDVVCRHYRGTDGWMHQLRCNECGQNTWIKRNEEYVCWNCDDPAKN